MSTANRGFLQKLWDFFCSLTLSIFLLIGLAVTSIIGTIVPQNAPREELARRFSESTIRLFDTIGFFDMYHSWWFILLLYLLTVNLIACSIKRLPRVWKIISEPVLKLDKGLEKSLSTVEEIKVSGREDELKAKLASFLKSNFAEPVITEADGECHLFAQKSAYSRLGVYVVHFSIIFIFVGAIIGSFAGYKAFVNIVEGTGTSTVYTRSEKAIDLGFTVKCEDFSVSFYDTGAPKEFKSLLTIIDQGKVIIDKRPIVVNDPLTYKGITFYQSSYGPAGDDAIYHLTVRARNGGAPVRLTARQGEGVKLPDGSTLQVMEATQDIRRFISQLSGPAARVMVTPVGGGEPKSFLIFKDFPQLDEQRGGNLIFTYDGADEKMYTGLQVAKDPGVWVVWFGCALMVVGICMAFFMSHKRIWIRIAGGKVVMAGTASKNPTGFSLYFDDLAAKLKNL